VANLNEPVIYFSFDNRSFSGLSITRRSHLEAAMSPIDPFATDTPALQRRDWIAGLEKGPDPAAGL
jgi:hypothetical protein